MAVSKAKKPVNAGKGTKNGAMVKWEEELAKQAEVAAGMEESTATGAFFSTKSGVLAFNGSPMPNNEMAVVILDAVLENVFYEGEYDPDVPSGPTCFAFGRDEKDMAPHKVCVEAGIAVAESCHGCPNNEWGSADKGRGKACRNTRRLAMLSAGEFDRGGKFVVIDDPEHYESTGMAFMKLPVTSVKGYAAFVKSVAGAMRRPPHGIFTRVKVVPDSKTQFKVVFEPLGTVPNELLGAVMQRREEAMATIESPYQLPEEEEQKPARGGKRGGKPAAGRTAARRKY